MHAECVFSVRSVVSSDEDEAVHLWTATALLPLQLLPGPPAPRAPHSLPLEQRVPAAQTGETGLSTHPPAFYFWRYVRQDWWTHLTLNHSRCISIQFSSICIVLYTDSHGCVTLARGSTGLCVCGFVNTFNVYNVDGRKQLKLGFEMAGWPVEIRSMLQVVWPAQAMFWSRW